MPTTAKALVEAAKAEVPDISPEKAHDMVEDGALLLDVRDATEVQAHGAAVGSHNIPRGMLEFRADPEHPMHDPQLRPDRPVIVHCAAGPRAALAGQTLLRMGYGQVFNLGGFKHWKEAGLPVTDPGDPGM